MAHQHLPARVWGWLVRHWRDLLQYGWPLVLFEAFNFVYDKLVYVYADLAWGPLWGSVIPTVGALIVNALIFWLYDYMKIDWLKARAMRELADEDNLTNFQKMATWQHKPRTTFKEKVVGELRFAFLLLLIDPVIVAVHYRDSHFSGVTAKDWFLLVKATLVACIVWAVQMLVVAYAIRAAWEWLAGIVLFTIPVPFMTNGLPVPASVVAALAVFVIAYQVVTRLGQRIIGWLNAR